MYYALKKKATAESEKQDKSISMRDIIVDSLKKLWGMKLYKITPETVFDLKKLNFLNNKVGNWWAA